MTTLKQEAWSKRYCMCLLLKSLRLSKYSTYQNFENVEPVLYSQSIMRVVSFLGLWESILLVLSLSPLCHCFYLWILLQRHKSFIFQLQIGLKHANIWLSECTVMNKYMFWNLSPTLRKGIRKLADVGAQGRDVLKGVNVVEWKG